MESANELNLIEMADQRCVDLTHWLRSDCGLSFDTLQSIAGDASFRRYFRVQTSSGSYIAMDAPPPTENVHPFVAISRALRAHGLQTPEIFAADLARGYLLLSDFGDKTLLRVLTPQNADVLYRAALDALAQIQACRDVSGWTVPAFDVTWLRNEWVWHQEWFLEKWLGISVADHMRELDACYNLLVDSALAQPQVFMHRDYHSANLMLLPDKQIGILDFQDAFIGPLTYDAASLLRDCYIDWPVEQAAEWINYYFVQLVKQGVLVQQDQQDYQRWVDWMGMQRHLKALLTFSRKYVRDQQPQYLRHIPRTLHYIITVAQQYPEMKALADFYAMIVKPAAEKELAACGQ